MTAKDKAKELVEKFEYNGEMIDDVRMNEEDAKQSALICVDEILREIPKRFDSEERYWKEVKQEIEKL